jgi:lipopolysaccharide export system protein LptC
MTLPAPPEPVTATTPERRSVMPNWMRRGRGHGAARAVSRRYSRLVSVLKIGLPLLSLVMIALIAVWPYLRDAQRTMGKIDKSQTAMINAHYFSRDRQDRPFSMTARSALEVPGQTNLVDLTNPEAEMTQTNGSWLTVTSDRGRYNQDDGRLLMLDGVHFLRDDGFEFVTDEAEIDTKSGNAWGDHKIVGQGPSGEIHADGFVAVDHGKTITFTHSGNATMLNGANTGAGATNAAKAAPPAPPGPAATPATGKKAAGQKTDATDHHPATDHGTGKDQAARQNTDARDHHPATDHGAGKDQTTGKGTER